MAVVIPCFNEEATIEKVVTDFKRVLPDAEVLVVDNASSDNTARLARAAGAQVLCETRRGKGFAVMTGFRAAQDADYVIMVDGDNTYPAEAAPKMLLAVQAGADMVVGTRLSQAKDGAFPTLHSSGNLLFIKLVRILFGLKTQDLFSGYRVVTRRFLQVSPLLARGFEIEVELAIQALVHRFVVSEIPVEYGKRSAQSESKLKTFSDGYRILLAIFALFRDYRPLLFFGLLSLV
ncbi:MAG: glycosyltransferase family 2 protein, partial [Pseudomonadota bacterium]